MLVFLGSALIILLAEMGDKTQLLAMAMATRFPAKSVLIGIFIATTLNHAFAVVVGNYLGTTLNMELIQMIASGSFILFGIWTIRGDTLDGEEKRKTVLGPIMTVAIAFFIAEMGDKTQLATVALAAKYNSPFATLMGTTTGMLIADAVGIYIGVVAGKRIPEKTIKWISALIFIVFGYLGLYTVVPKEYLKISYVIALLGITALSIYIISRGKREVSSQERG